MVSPADLTYLVGGGAALLAAVVPRVIARRPVSLPMVFLLLGAGLFLTPLSPVRPDPRQYDAVVEHLTELTVIVALMGAGLALDRAPSWRTWRSTVRLLAVAMPLTIAAVAVLGHLFLGLSLAGAVLLGAVLAPTDPVLAGDVQVGEPAGEEPDVEGPLEDETRFALTSEAGLNDALAFPFVLAAVALAGSDSAVGWVPRWLAVDVVYRLGVGAAVGVAVGLVLARLAFRSRSESLRLSEHQDGIVAVAATFSAYGVAEVVGSYGFVAVFVTAVVLRSSERFHDYHVVLHAFIEQLERLLTVLVLVLVGGALARVLLGEVTWQVVVLTVLVIFVVRPAAAWISLVRLRLPRRERSTIAFFGVRGVGSLFYLAYAANHGLRAESSGLWAVTTLVIGVSVLVHGSAATPVMQVVDRDREARSESP